MEIIAMIKRIYAITLVLMLAGQACAGKHYVTLELDVDEKEASITGTPGLRETIDVRLTNTLTYAADDMCVYVVGKTNAVTLVVAQCATFTDQTGYFSGELDLTTTNLIAQFEGLHDQAEKVFTVLLVDTANKDTLVNDIITIKNNPYISGMEAPTELP